MVIFSLPIPFLFGASAFAGMKGWTTAVPLIGCLAGGARLPAWVSLAAVPGTGRGSGTDVAGGGAGTSRDPPCAGSGKAF